MKLGAHKYMKDSPPLDVKEIYEKHVMTTLFNPKCVCN